MGKGKIINFILLLIVIALLSIFALAVRIRPVGDAVVLLQAAGISCGSSAGEIEKALEPAGGVSAVELDPKGGLVIVGYDSRKVRPDTLAGTISGAGYGCSVLRVLTMEEFRRMTGRFPGRGAGTGVCGAGCGAR